MCKMLESFKKQEAHSSDKDALEVESMGLQSCKDSEGFSLDVEEYSSEEQERIWDYLYTRHSYVKERLESLK